MVMAKRGFSGYLKDAGGRKKRLLVAVELLDNSVMTRCLMGKRQLSVSFCSPCLLRGDQTKICKFKGDKYRTDERASH